jgi:hypothetical protein
MHIIKTIASIILSLSSSLFFALEPITPEKVLTNLQIENVHSRQNYFLHKNMDYTFPIWKDKNRLYSSHYLKSRDHYLSINDAIHRVLSDGFPIQYKLEELYRAKLKVHVQIASVTPSIRFSFGEGVGGLGIDKIFSSLFGFLLPANWMKITNQKRVYKLSKYMMMITVLNEILDTKIEYIKQHQLIHEFEIINFYFIHLQIFAKYFSHESRGLYTLMGKFSVDGTDMATQRGKTKLGFDRLAKLMALDKLDADPSVAKFNITDIDNFPWEVAEPEKSDLLFNKKELFTSEVVKRSIELKAAKELYKISKLNIGITAFGSMFSTNEMGSSQDAQFSFNFGYDSLPKILISNSLKKTAKIDLRKEYINMLDAARRSFDLYTNSLGGYTEAKRGLCLNRKAFIKNLQHLIDTKSEPDSLFVLSLNQLIASELKLNNALHGSLIARAHIDRFLLTDEDNFLAHLPEQGKIIKIFNHFKVLQEKKAKNNKLLQDSLVSVRKTHELKSILYSQALPQEIVKKAVADNIANLIFKKITFRKSKKFYTLLYSYIQKNQISLSFQEKQFLLKHLHK